MGAFGGYRSTFLLQKVKVASAVAPGGYGSPFQVKREKIAPGSTFANLHYCINNRHKNQIRIRILRIVMMINIEFERLVILL